MKAKVKLKHRLRPRAEYQTEHKDAWNNFPTLVNTEGFTQSEAESVEGVWYKQYRSMKTILL